MNHFYSATVVLFPNLEVIYYYKGRDSGAVVSTGASQEEGCLFISLTLDLFLVSAWVLSSFSNFLPLSRDMHRRLIENCKWSARVNVRWLIGCLDLLLFLPIMQFNWQFLRGELCLCPKTAGIGSSNTRDPECRRSDGWEWMDEQLWLFSCWTTDDYGIMFNWWTEIVWTVGPMTWWPAPILV